MTDVLTREMTKERSTYYMAKAVKVDVKNMAERGYRMAQQKRNQKKVVTHREAVQRETQKAEGLSGQPVTIAALPQQVEKRKVAAYCRVSTLMDSQETSIEAQRAHYLKTIQSNDEWELAGIYLEVGVSGTKAEIRPELQKLLADCKDGKVDLVLTKSISRFARNTSDCLEMVRQLSALGVNIRFEKENIDTSTMDSEFMLSILACLAEDESRSISGNMKWGIRKRFENGTFKQARPPYGYDWDQDHLVIVPEKAEVVREIFTKALDGCGAPRITKELNARKVPSPTGKMWTQRSVHAILTNPAYIGDALYQKTYMDDQFRQCRNHGELDQYYDEDHHEPIVGREVFQKAQEMINQRAKEAGYKGAEEKARGIHRYCFSGILFCKVCGSPMHRQIRSKNSICWICHRHVNHLDSCRMKPQDEKDLKAAYINCMNKLAWAQSTRGSANRILDVYEEMLGKTEAEKNAERLAEIEVLLEENRKETRKLNAVIMREHFLPRHREKKAFLTMQEQQLLSEKNRILISGAPSGTLQQLKAFISGWRITARPDAFPEESFNRFVDHCTVYSGKMVTFHFRCGLELTESLYRSTLQEA